MESHRAYEPEDLPWPDLDPELLEVLESIPGHLSQAVQDELTGASFLEDCAQEVEESALREVLHLQAYEERRHARLIEHMIRRYDLNVPKGVPRRMPVGGERGYVWFGHLECTDCFAGYGFVGLVARAGTVPKEFVQIFDRLLDEETQHTVFFVNWLAWSHRPGGVLGVPQRMARELQAYSSIGVRLFEMARTASPGAESVKGYAPTTVASLLGDITPGGFLACCVDEYERRVARIDPELLRPSLLPSLARWALPFVRKAESLTSSIYS